jgi:hypothetical protein
MSDIKVVYVSQTIFKIGLITDYGTDNYTNS